MRYSSFFLFFCSAILRVENDRKFNEYFLNQFAQHSVQKNQSVLLFFSNLDSLSIQQRNTGTCEIRESNECSVRVEIQTTQPFQFTGQFRLKYESSPRRANSTFVQLFSQVPSIIFTNNTKTRKSRRVQTNTTKKTIRFVFFLEFGLSLNLVEKYGTCEVRESMQRSGHMEKNLNRQNFFPIAIF